MEKLGWHHRNQVIKVNFPETRQSIFVCVLLVTRNWECGATSAAFLTKRRTLETAKPKSRDIPRSNCTVFFENTKITKDKDWGTVPDRRRLEIQDNRMQPVILDLILGLKIMLLGQLEKFEWGFWIRWWFWTSAGFLIVRYCGYVGERPWFQEICSDRLRANETSLLNGSDVTLYVYMSRDGGRATYNEASVVKFET